MAENLHGVSRIKKTLRALHGHQRMLFNAQISQVVKVATIPCEVRMTIAEARHQCPSSAVKNTYTWVLFQYLDVRHFANSGKALPWPKHESHVEQYLEVTKHARLERNNLLDVPWCGIDTMQCA